VYAATAVFVLAAEQETVPGWPATADHISILIKTTARSGEDVDVAEIGFLVPDLARPHVHVGAQLLVMEGPKVVAHAEISKVHP
jgi:hypothetical protein